MDEAKRSPLESLTRGFRLALNGRFWTISCKRCEAEWTLPLGDPHPGSVLHLLNHEASHDEERRPKGR